MQTLTARTDATVGFALPAIRPAPFFAAQAPLCAWSKSHRKRLPDALGALRCGLAGNVPRRSAALLLVCAALQAIEPKPSMAEGLLGKLRRRDWSQLSKPLLPSVVALPLNTQTFPEWLEGTWQASTEFAGFELPVKKLKKETLMKDKSIPGFQKLSLAQIPDVGAPGRFEMRFIKRADGSVVEDKPYNLQSMIDNGLGRVQAVKAVTCPAADRCSVSFVPGATRNAEQIELFFNARESEAPGADGTFAFAEFTRQVTYSLSTTMGVARQEVGEYQVFWTLRPQRQGSVRGNILVAAYLQPQDALFFEAPAAPVVIYSYDLVLTKKDEGDVATDAGEVDEDEDEEDEQD